MKHVCFPQSSWELPEHQAQVRIYVNKGPQLVRTWTKADTEKNHIDLLQTTVDQSQDNYRTG